MNDLRHALRALRHTPTFTATAVLILGLGIGMASAVFTVFQAVVLRRLPVRDQDRIVELSGAAKGAAREVPLTLDQVRRFRQESRTLQSFAGFAHWGSVSAPVTDGDRPLLLRQATVTGSFFQVLGAAPSLGRLLGRRTSESTLLIGPKPMPWSPSSATARGAGHLVATPRSLGGDCTCRT
jgi:putative ABC transport system permease protein